MQFLTSLVDFDVSPVDVSICDRSALTRGESRRLSLSEADMRASSQVLLQQ
jgi:hypothetical protein